MNEKNTFKFTTIIFAVLFLLSGIAAIRFGISDRYSRSLYNKYREQLDTVSAKNKELGEQLAAARTTNNELRGVITESRELVGDCREQLAKGIQTARGAIELVREIREKVVLLESRLSDSNNDLNHNDSSAPSSEVEQYGKGKS